MSADDVLRMKGALAEKEQEAKRLAILLAGHRDRVRQMTDRHKPVEKIDTTELRVEVDTIVDLNARLQTLLDEIAELRRDLNLDRYEAR